MSARFRDEARAGLRIKSPHVAHVLDVVTTDAMSFIVMEYLDGQNLVEVLRERGPLPVVEVADLLLQAAEAIAEAHGLRIIHRDLKPQNLFVTTGPDGLPLVKVLDFGIAKSTAPDETTAGGAPAASAGAGVAVTGGVRRRGGDG